ncbi:MAG: pyridoxamine 5'-phosphate oxidase family protein [Armatimonadota bacterium]|nr:pyridoxamine 5'-phosphate oxidase family protein [bacterium]
MNVQDTRIRAKKIIDAAVNAVFMTLDADGFPHPRTMWTAGMDDDFTIYFVTGKTLQKVKQIESNPKVCAFWTQVEDGAIGWSYTLIKGHALISENQALKDRFWVDELQEYFPGGKQDPNYVVIVVRPRELLIMDSHKYPLERVEFQGSE